MRITYPFEFELSPKEVDPGIRWLTIRVKNIGSESLESLDLRLHTLDSYFIMVLGTGEHISHLAPGAETTRAFQVEATGSSHVCASVSGFSSEGAFSVDSPWVKLTVTGNAAELVSLFAMTKPYTPMGEVVKIQATVKGLRNSKNLDLEFWVRRPSGTTEEITKIVVEEISAGKSNVSQPK